MCIGVDGCDKATVHMLVNRQAEPESSSTVGYLSCQSTAPGNPSRNVPCRQTYHEGVGGATRDETQLAACYG